MHNQKTALKWYIRQTEDKKIKQFAVLHVADAYDDFETIKEVKATNSIGLEEYSSIHRQPEIGENFYQIRIEYEDRTIDFTMYNLVVFEAEPPVVPIMVNAVQHKLSIDLSKYLDEAVNYFISSINGQVLMNGKLNKDHGNIETLNINKLTTGTYIIYLRPENHREIVQKFVFTKN